MTHLNPFGMWMCVCVSQCVYKIEREREIALGKKSSREMMRVVDIERLRDRTCKRE